THSLPLSLTHAFPPPLSHTPSPSLPLSLRPMDKTLMNVTWRAGGILLDEGGDRVTLTRFHSEEDTFILGIDKVNGKRGTLYLMSRTPRVSQAVVEGFKRQAVCYAADHVYVVPGRREKDPRN
ncbi:hypothetical protein FKM82_029625, partial [Ascaphus truei]